MKTRKIARPWMLVTVLAAVAVVVLAACGGGSAYGGGSSATTPASAPQSSPGGAATDKVAIQNYSFTPAQTTVSVGTTVTWTNNDSMAHDVTSTDGPEVGAAITATFASKSLTQGQTFSFTFDTPGTYYYECTIHASMETMHAVVIVK